MIQQLLSQVKCINTLLEIILQKLSEKRRKFDSFITVNGKKEKN